MEHQRRILETSHAKQIWYLAYCVDCSWHFLATWERFRLIDKEWAEHLDPSDQPF